MVIPSQPRDKLRCDDPGAFTAELHRLVKEDRDAGSSIFHARGLLLRAAGWPFGPEDPRATELARWLAGEFVDELRTDRLEQQALDTVRHAHLEAHRAAIRARYAIPEFKLSVPYLHLPFEPRQERFTAPDGSDWLEARKKWVVECARLKAEHETALAAQQAAKGEYDATYGDSLKRRAAEIGSLDADFPERQWKELIATAFREQAVDYYRFENDEADDVAYSAPIVAGLLRPGEPATIGGPQKTCKTILSIELAAALATGTPFLGMAVPEPVGVWALTKETPVPLWRERFALAVRARGRDPKEAERRLLVTSDVRAVQDEAKRDALSLYLRRSGTKVAILDPLYKILPVCLSSSLTSEGQALEHLAQPFAEADCSPVFVHHFTKHKPIGEAPALDDLSGAAVGPFVRSWLLVNRRAEYTARGLHELLALCGTSSGDCARTPIGIDEHKWRLTVAADPDSRTAHTPPRDHDDTPLLFRTDRPMRPARKR